MAGEFGVAHDLLAQSRAIHDALGVSLHAVLAQDEAYIALLEGDPAAAEAALEPCVAQLTEMGEKALLGTMAAMLARALADQGRDDEAWRLVDTVDEVASPDDLAVEIERRTLRALLLARRGDTETADRLSSEAVTIAASTDWLDERGEVLLTRGRILRAYDRPDEASRAFHRAFELFSRKGNVVSAQRARAAADEAPPPRPQTRRFRTGAEESRGGERRTKRR
jgi:tetratricopeptide (TPR) repeat protein